MFRRRHIAGQKRPRQRGGGSMRDLLPYHCAPRWNSGLTRQMTVHAAEEMSAVETGQMSAAETGQMSAVETGQMSSDETRQMSSVARADICLVPTHNVEVSEVSIVAMSQCSSRR